MALVATVTGTSSAASSPLPGAVDTVLAKADPDLLADLEVGTTSDLEVIVVGQPHADLTAERFTDRAEAVRELDRRAAPFFEHVEQLAGAGGATVDGRWSIIPAIKLTVDLHGLRLLAASDAVTQLDGDRDDAVRVDPIPDSEFRASNTGGRRMLQAEDLWAMGYRGEGVRISIIDTGIDPTHEAFKNADGSSRIVGWNDLYAGHPIPYDDHGHGTHVGATAAGSTLYDDPDFGFFQEEGVAPRAELMAAKFLSAAGSGSSANAIEALKWSFEQGADITSNSWGSGCSGNTSVIAAVDGYTQLGMLSVFAAGNSGPTSGSVGGPACGESALSVGAVDEGELVASFSSRGPCSDPYLGTGSRICPDVVAKGVAVRSAIPRSGATAADPSGYRVWQGTSMATPHMAGAAALIEQMKQDLTGTGWDTDSLAEERAFKLTSKDLGPDGADNAYGWGLPQLTDVHAALTNPEAVIEHDFGISVPLVRLNDSTSLSFAVRNMGGVTATGAFTTSLTAPDGTQTTLESKEVALGFLDEERFGHTFTVTSDVPFGTYTFRGSFAYSWTRPDGSVVSDEVVVEDVFDVKRVFLEFTLDGLDAETLPGTPQFVTVTATNTGNEAAGDVVIELTVPDAYVFMPGENFTPSDMRTRYANPAPGQVREDQNFDRVTLIFDAGDLAVQDSFSFTTRLVPTTPGTYRFLSVGRFSDGAGRPFSQGDVTTQTVKVV